MIAIIPAAGRGERMASVTMGTGSKEALLLGGVSILDRVIDEVLLAGVDRIVVVSAPGKTDIESIVAKRSENIDIHYQHKQLGLADAILCSGVMENSIIALPDTVFSSEVSPSLKRFYECADAAVAVQNVPEINVKDYGIAVPHEIVCECKSECRCQEKVKAALKFIEKPQLTETTSRLAISARYYLSDRVLRFLRETRNNEQEEIPDLTEMFNEAIQRLMNFHLLELPSTVKRFDCGSPSGYREAQEYFTT